MTVAIVGRPMRFLTMRLDRLGVTRDTCISAAIVQLREIAHSVEKPPGDRWDG
jgi:hypothetical protein